MKNFTIYCKKQTIRQLLFVTILIALPILTFAQEYQYVPFPDSGAIWSEVYNPSHKEGETFKDIYERFVLSGEDIIIKDLTYKKLFLFYDSIFVKSKSTYIGGIREDNEKHVYYIGDSVHWLKPYNSFNDYDKEKELLLYDFSLGIGDTLKEGNINIFKWLTVKNIDTVQVENTLRKKYSFNDRRLEWIEGIGSIRGLLFAVHPEVTGSYPPNNSLICFIQNGSVIYHEEYFDDCFPSIVSVETKQTKFNINVCPNPANRNNIRFEWGNRKIEAIEIFNFKGMQVGSVNVTGKTSVEYPAEALQPGIYLYRATGPDNEKQTGKFVVK